MPPWHARSTLISRTHRPQSRALQVVRYQQYRAGHVAIRRHCHRLRASRGLSRAAGFRQFPGTTRATPTSRVIMRAKI